MTETTRARGKRQRGTGAGHGGPANGPGWGGPAKGAGVKITGATQPTPEAKVAGKVEARTARELSQPHVPAMVEVWRSIAMDKAAPPAARVVAAEKLVDRAEGKATQDYNVKHNFTAAAATDDALAAIALAGSGVAPAPEDDQA